MVRKLEATALDLEAIKSEYFRMRTAGTDAKSALSSLRAHVVGLETRQREKLLEQLRLWEIGRAASSLGQVAPPESAPAPQPPPAQPAPAPRPAPPIKPLAGTPTLKINRLPAEPAVEKVACPQCGKINKTDDIFCSACGHLLTMERGVFDTRTFIDNNDGLHSDEYFGPDTMLVLMVKETQETFKIRPQDQPHEVIVGRGAGVAMRPDIDLAPQQASLLGVSRLHLSLRFNEKHRTLSASDMGSANGTYINGQRLYPEEVRIIRHGDELRLGKLTLVVYFYRSNPPEQAPG